MNRYRPSTSASRPTARQRSGGLSCSGISPRPPSRIGPHAHQPLPASTRSLALPAATLGWFLFVATADALCQQTPSAPATTGPARPVPFQPGVVIDFSQPQVQVDATVVLRKGLLELLACSPGTKEHESILRVNARPVHIYQAMGLIGLEPGQPPHRDPATGRIVPATGQPLELLLRYRQAGQVRTVPAYRWLYDLRADRPMRPQYWVFAGSQRLPDGSFYADEDGTVVTVVDFAGALIALPESHTSADQQLSLAALTEHIPPVGTPCTLIIRPAPPQRAEIRMDRFGRCQLDGAPIERPALPQRLRQMAAARPHLLVVVSVAPASLPGDIRGLLELIQQAGIPADRIQTRQLDQPAFPRHDPQATAAFVQAQIELHRALLERILQEQQRLAAALGQRAAELERRSATLRQTIAELRRWLEELTRAAATSSPTR